jgi:hypothetical protein
VDSASFPAVGATQTANLAVQKAGSVATVAITESNATAQDVLTAAFSQ